MNSVCTDFDVCSFLDFLNGLDAFNTGLDFNNYIVTQKIFFFSWLYTSDLLLFISRVPYSQVAMLPFSHISFFFQQKPVSISH